MTINPPNSKVVDPFLNDLSESVEEVINNPDKKEDGQSALYEMIATAPDRESVKDFVFDFLKDLYKAK
jgi:hypothetical protein